MILIASLVVLLNPFDINGAQLTPPSQTQLTDVNGDQAHLRIKHDHQLRSKTSVVSHEFPLVDDDLWYKEKKEDLDTFAQLQCDLKASFPPSFTICSTLMTSATRGYPSLFFTLLGKSNNNYLNAFLDIGMESLILISGLYSFKPKQKIDRVFPDQWVSTCLAVNTESGLLQWVVDTKLIANVTLEAIRQNAPQHPADLSRRLLLGVENMGPGKWTTFSNKVTLLNIYSSTMSIEEMQKMTFEGKERCSSRGDYLSWEETKWTLKGDATKETWETADICMAKPNVNILPSMDFAGIEGCANHCDKLNSRMPSVVTFEKWENLKTILQRNLWGKGLSGNSFFLSLTDVNNEGNWTDYYTGQAMQHQGDFAPGEPNGEERQNCVILQANGIGWADYYCDDKDGCLCDHRPTSYVRLIGLKCEASVIDTLYLPKNSRHDIREFVYRGAQDTTIEYRGSIWRVLVERKNVTGITKASRVSFALGKNNWTIQGDMACNEGESYTLPLKLTGCQEGNFTCDDGQCVAMEERCDQLPQCRDESDEIGCKILVLKRGYNMNVPPISSEGGKKSPVDVLTSIDFLKLVTIDEEDYSIEIQFEISLQWRDNRATYHNLKDDEALNALTKDDISALWIPEVIYENTDQKESTRLGEFGAGEWKTSVVVKREGNFTRSGLDMVDETEIFKGNENSLLMRQSYTHTFQCPFDLARYPFDTQVTCFLLTHSFHSFSLFRPVLLK